MGATKGSFITRVCFSLRSPNETVEERRAYYAGKTQEAKDALDNTMFNETRADSRYAKYDPQRDSNVIFGRR